MELFEEKFIESKLWAKTLLIRKKNIYIIVLYLGEKVYDIKCFLFEQTEQWKNKI